MCKLLVINRDRLPTNISIEFERRADLRAYEIVVVNSDKEGNEVGCKLICFDNGKIGTEESHPTTFRS